MEFNKKQKKAIALTIVAIVAIIVSFIVISVMLIISNSNNSKVDTSIGYKSIKEIVENSGSKYKSESFNANRDYPTEVALSFKYDLYTDDESNEEFYMKLIDELVKFTRYTNLKLTDKDKDIVVEIICKDNEIYSITINGIEDYFIYKDSQISVSKYKEIKTVNLHSKAEVLNALINNNWNSGIDCGTRDSIFQGYFIYFDEGIKYKKIGSKIYNIVFDNKFEGEVLDNISASESISSVKSKLGTPSFENEKLGIIGYKGKDFYAFFNGKEVSIYKRTVYDYSEFWSLINKFIDEDSTMEFKEFMNELTYIWPDYSEYDYDTDKMFISYPNKGIDIKLNYDNESGIIVYNNISENMSKVQSYLENTEFISKLQLDNVYNAEIRRVQKENSLKDKCEEFVDSLKDEEGNSNIGKSNLFEVYMELDEKGISSTAYFLSKNGELPNREFTEPINSFTWIDDKNIAYGVYNEGIYLYNVVDGTKRALTKGLDEYIINRYEDKVLYFDRAEMPINL